MTIEEIKASTDATVCIYEIAKIIGIDAKRLMDQARQDQSKLSFPVIVAFDSVRVPRVPFLRFIGCDI